MGPERVGTTGSRKRKKRQKRKKHGIVEIKREKDQGLPWHQSPVHFVAMECPRVAARSSERERLLSLSLSYHKPLEIHLIPYMSRHRNSLSLSLSLRHIHQIRTIKKNNKRIYKSETGSSHYKHNGCFKQIKRGGTWWRRRGGRRNNRHQFQSVYVRLGRYAQPFASNTHSDQNTPKHRIGLIFFYRTKYLTIMHGRRCD